MNKRFEALDAFRGLCALSVVIFHIHIIGSIAELDFFRGSAIFVQFFFVLSGFVLTHGYGFKEDLNFSTFMKSRFFRLYPLHFFMFVFFISLQLFKLAAYELGGFTFDAEPFSGRSAISEIIPNLLLIQSWTPFTEPLSFNAPSWSISIEFYMYALLFLTIVGFKNNKVLSWICMSSIAFFLIYSESEILVETVLIGLSCFFGGAFTYVIYKKISHLQPSYVLGTVVELLLIISVILMVQSTFEHRVIIGPILFFFTILFFAYESGMVSKFLKVKQLQYAGKLSYSIYMVHAGVIYCLGILAILLEKFFTFEIRVKVEDLTYLTFGNYIFNNIVVLIIVLIVIYISSITYKYIEVPGQKLSTALAAKFKRRTSVT